MEKFKFLPHTADVKFQSFGSSLNEAFSNAALAMVNVITDDKVKEKVSKVIEVESEDEKALLYDFLEEFLYLLDTEGFLLSKVKKLKIEKGVDFKLRAEIVGDTVLEDYEINTHIKAMTYQEMEIKKEKDIFILQVVLDL